MVLMRAIPCDTQLLWQHLVEFVVGKEQFFGLFERFLRGAIGFVVSAWSYSIDRFEGRIEFIAPGAYRLRGTRVPDIDQQRKKCFAHRPQLGRNLCVGRRIQQ